MSAGWQIEWHAELDSTMTRAEQLAPTAPSGLVVVADYQSQGRGTRGRVWTAPPGTCLTFTIISRLPFALAELETLPRRVSESVAACLRDDLALACDLKEPNDILVQGRKLCGVLCLSHLVGERVAWVLCGIGLNTFMQSEQLPRLDATSLCIEGVAAPPHAALLDMLLARLTWLRE